VYVYQLWFHSIAANLRGYFTKNNVEIPSTLFASLTTIYHDMVRLCMLEVNKVLVSVFKIEIIRLQK
jgi:hypothetical protein